jgi:2-(1,2-epoxy-1,2-dihydrophenyl)acetyl-CoA isomerase
VLEETVKYFFKDHIAEIILSRPEQYNSFNAKMRSDLLETLNKIELEPKIRVVILRGSGPGFTAGADLNEPFPPPISKHLENDYKPIFDKIVNSRQIYMAAVHGSAAGIGAALAMVCDLLVMAQSAKISMIFSNIGLVPDGGATWLLQKALGYRKAFELIVEGGHITAAECLRYGIANKVFNVDSMEEETLNWATALSKRSPLAAEGSKRLLRKSFLLSYDEAFMAEAFEQDSVSLSEDFANARDAFLKKQKPIFRGN